MSLFKSLFGRTSTASADPAPASLPPGWEIIMDGTTPKYYHRGMSKLQTEFPQPDREPEPERELPAGWKKQNFRGYVEYVNTLDPHAISERSFPTKPAQRPLSPLFEKFTVGDKTMYRSRTNPNYVTDEFQPANDDQIKQMWEEYNKPDAQWRGGKRKQSKRKQRKRKQSKRKQSKRKQSKRKQSNK
jgi:hypothetical protein